MNDLKSMIIKSIGLAIALFGLSQYAKAVTDDTKYVNSSCIGVHYGDGSSSSCAASDGGAGAYDTCSRMEAQNRDLVSADKRQIVYFSGSAADATACVFGGWTMDATRYLQLTCTGAACHSGVWSTSKYRLSIATDTVALGLTNYLRVDNLQIERSGSTGSADVIKWTDWHTDVWLTNNLIRGVTGATDSDGYNFGINVAYMTGGRIANNIIYSTRGIQLRPVNNSAVLLANNTVIATKRGIRIFRYESGSYVITATNNLVTSAEDSDYDSAGTNGTLTTSNNASHDATSPDASYRSATFTFVGGGDYHLASTDAGAKDNGADLSSYYSTDIDLQTRAAPWDIGADEYQSAGGSAVAALISTGQIGYQQ